MSTTSCDRVSKTFLKVLFITQFKLLNCGLRKGMPPIQNCMELAVCVTHCSFFQPVAALRIVYVYAIACFHFLLLYFSYCFLFMIFLVLYILYTSLFISRVRK